MDSSGKTTVHGLPCPSPGDLHDPGIKPESTALAGGFCPTEPPGEAHLFVYSIPKTGFIVDLHKSFET